MARAALRWTGNLLLLACMLGLALFAYVSVAPEVPPPWVVDTPLDLPRVAALTGGAASASAPGSPREALIPPPGYRPITHIAVDRIGLDVDVVPAQLVDRNGGTTWEVPAFKVGHAEATAGAGAAGNAVLLGHVASVRSGDVFRDLEHVHVNDVVHVFAEAERFDYRVVAVDRVPRTDNQVLEQGATPTVSLITCTGMWLPTIWDYTERLVVRAELAQAR